MKLVFSKAALGDLIRLRKFIEQHDPKAAQRVADRLRGSIEKLKDSPQIGRPVVPQMEGEIRELIVGKYVVRYDVRQLTLYILRVWHGKEDRF